MEAIIKTGCTKAANLASAAISLAIVFGGGAAFAEGLSGFAASPLTGMVGDFSQADLDQLEQASTSEATTAHLAAMSLVHSRATRPQTSSEAREALASSVEVDLFPHSGQLLPLLVVRPDDARTIVQVAVPNRPGMAQPVGVSRSHLRSLSQRDRSGR